MRPRVITLLVSLSILSVWQSIVFGADIFQTPAKETFLKTIYSTKNGLPQNTPTDILQTQDGYLWVATFGGLARFDGVNFTVFTTSNTSELINNRITAIYEDHNNILWIGSEDGDIMSYQNGIFSLIKKNVGTPIDNAISSFYVDKNDNLWIGTGGELRTYNIKTKQFTSFAEQTILKKPIPSNDAFHINKITEDSEGNLWMASSGGLIRFRNGDFTNFNTDDGLPDNHIYSIAVNPNGGLWVSTNKIVGAYNNGIFTQIAKIDYDGDFSHLIINQENHLFFTSKKLLYEVSSNSVQTYDISDVASDGIRPVFFDKHQNLWLGTNNGLIQFRQRHIKVFSTIADNIWAGTSAIVEAPDKSVWVASGKDLIHWQKGIFETYTIPKDLLYLTALAIDKNNTLWVGTYGGVFKFENNTFTKFAMPRDFHVAPMFFDRDGNLWVGERIGGLLKFENGIFKEKYTVQNGLANNWVSYITQTRNGTIWIGTKGGLSHLENGFFTNFTTDDGFGSDNIRDVYEDGDGTLWIGTYGGGISRFRDGKLITITSKNGLAEDIVSRILVDDNGIFWILGNKGIFSVSRNSLNDFADGKTLRIYCTIYDEKDGMEVGEGSGGNQPAGWKTSDGKLWFPMIRGGIIIDPIKPNVIPAPVYVEYASLDKQKINTREKLEIQPGQSNLEIGYTAVSFIKPEQIQFRYKLDGYDKDWQDVGTRRIAYYPYLPPGNYKFRVMATNGNDIWSENDASLEIIVHSPFWRTWWFYSLLFLTLILLIVFAYQRRLGRLQRRRLKQEEFSRQLINAHESERLRIAGELHDSLGQNLLIIKNWSLLILSKLPQKSKYKKQLEEISETASRALEETRTIARNLRPQHLQRFGITETLQSMVKRVESSSQIKFDVEIENIDNLFSADEELSIYRIVQECLNNVLKHSGAKYTIVTISKLNGKIEFTNSQDKVLIQIIDDGQGFDFQSKSKSSFGLDNIVQRVQLLGGKYSIKSNPGKGTQINISLYIRQK